METVKKWNKDFIALNHLDPKIHSKQNGKIAVIKPDQVCVSPKHSHTRSRLSGRIAILLNTHSLLLTI